MDMINNKDNAINEDMHLDVGIPEDKHDAAINRIFEPDSAIDKSSGATYKANNGDKGRKATTCYLTDKNRLLLEEPRPPHNSASHRSGSFRWGTRLALISLFQQAVWASKNDTGHQRGAHASASPPTTCRWKQSGSLLKGARLSSF